VTARQVVWDYLNGKELPAIAAKFEVARTAVTQWLGVRHRWNRGAVARKALVQRRGSAGATPGVRAADRGRAPGRGLHRQASERALESRPDTLAVLMLVKNTIAMLPRLA
jgi:hypothetical protein